MDFLRALPVVGPLWNWVRSWIGLNREHDVKIFEKLNAMLDESRVDRILNQSIYTSYLRLEEREHLYKFVEALQREENQYLESVVRLRAEELGWEMDQLLGIVGSTFWSDDRDIFRFRPDPIDPAVYDAEWKELNEKLEKAWAAYRTYRKAVRDRLRV